MCLAKSHISRISSIYSYYESLLSTPIEEYSHKRIRLRLPQIPLPLLTELLDEVLAIIKEEEVVLKLSSDIVIVGDLCGHILELLQILRQFGTPQTHKYLFLGNIIGDGEFSLETSTLVYCLKVLYPDKVFFLRGSNEVPYQTSSLYKNIIYLYSSNEIINKYRQIFFQTSLAAIIPNEYKPFQPILCIHGGIGTMFYNIKDLYKIQKPIYKFTPIISDLIYSGPIETLPHFLPCPDDGCVFGKDALAQFLYDNHLSLLIRGHGTLEEGVKILFDQTLISVSSCSVDHNVFNFIEDDLFLLTPDKDIHNFGAYYLSPNESKAAVFPGLDILSRSNAVFLVSEREDYFTLPVHSISSIPKHPIITFENDVPNHNNNTINHRIIAGKNVLGGNFLTSQSKKITRKVSLTNLQLNL